MSLRAKGYVFLLMMLAASLSLSSLDVYWGLMKGGIEKLETYREFSWILASVSTTSSMPSPLAGFGVTGQTNLPLSETLIVRPWIGPGLTLLATLLIVMNLYRWADFHHHFVLGLYGMATLHSVAVGVLIGVYGRVLPGYCLAILPPILGWLLTLWVTPRLSALPTDAHDDE
jgi:hypothetical protein